VYGSETKNVRYKGEYVFDSFAIMDPGTYRIIIYHAGSDYDTSVTVKQVCFEYDGEVPPPTWVASMTPAPTNTPTPSLTPTAWQGDPGTPEPEEPVCCTDGAPAFPPASGDCGTLALLDWLNIIKVLSKLLCELFDLIGRAIRWLGRFIQWLLCPVNDVIAWLQCLWSLIATIFSNLVCIVRQPFEFVLYLWRAFLIEVST